MQNAKRVIKLVVMGNRGDLTNEQWERIEAVLPKAKTKRGRPAQDHRKLLHGISWVLRTGGPWRDLPERYGKGTTIYSRFQRWRKSGVYFTSYPAGHITRYCKRDFIT